MREADLKDWIITGSVVRSKKEWMIKDTEARHLREAGIKNSHSYTVIDVR
jgi:hypothetical protein